MLIITALNFLFLAAVFEFLFKLSFYRVCLCWMMEPEPPVDLTEPEVAASREELSKEFIEPPAKKAKSLKLEDRLVNVLSCNVCFGLPTSACYQCCRGHLMCAACFNHLLADSKLKDEQPKCPSCRVDIGNASCTRNLAAEKAISELPIDCIFCSTSFPRHMIVSHQDAECVERVVNCRFEPLGCLWNGPFHESGNHESSCVHPNISGEEILKCLEIQKNKHLKELSMYCHVTSLLSHEQVFYHDIQLRPYRTMDFVTRLYYESNRFQALGQMWVVKAFIDNVEKNPSNPTIISDRKLNYQLLLKSKVTNDIELYSLILRAPYEHTAVQPAPIFHRFTNSETESELQPIGVADTNKLIGARVINVRIFLFHNKSS